MKNKKPAPENFVYVVGATPAEARKHYKPKQGEVVAYCQYGDKLPEADNVRHVYVDPAKAPKNGN